MNKNDCNVVRDLMPLVLDRVASDESRALVEEHMGSCGKCRKQYEEMKAEMPGETRAEYEKEQKTIVDALKKARRQKRRRRILQIVLPAVISLAILIGGATVSKAKVSHVIIGVFLFEGVLVFGQQIANSAIAGGGLSEVMRILISNGIILYALTQSGGGRRE